MPDGDGLGIAGLGVMMLPGPPIRPGMDGEAVGAAARPVLELLVGIGVLVKVLVLVENEVLVGTRVVLVGTGVLVEVVTTTGLVLAVGVRGLEGSGGMSAPSTERANSTLKQPTCTPRVEFIGIAKQLRSSPPFASAGQSRVTSKAPPLPHVITLPSMQATWLSEQAERKLSVE